MRIFITGATGFVGKNLCHYLSRLNMNIKGLSRDDLTNLDWLTNGGEAIIHLAGKAHDLRKASNPDEYYEVNFELTKKIYDEFLESDVKKFIFISSVKAVADVVDDVLTEERIPNPQTHYGKSKLKAEQYIQRQILPQGKSYYVLRPCMIHGSGNKGNLNLLYKLLKGGFPYPLAAFDNRRSFLSIVNLCFVIKELLEREIASGIYNVADNESLSTTEVVNILSASLNRKPKLWSISRKFIRQVARMGDLLRLPFNTERLTKLTENYVVSNKKIKEAIKVPFPLEAKEGLILTAASFDKM